MFIIRVVVLVILNWGRATPGCVNKFPGGRKPLPVVHHGKFDQQIYQEIHKIHKFSKFLISQGGLKQSTIT